MGVVAMSGGVILRTPLGRRQVILQHLAIGGSVQLLPDTVGCRKRLPHELVASCRSPLEVARAAYRLLMRVDLGQENWRGHIETTEQLLR